MKPSEILSPCVTFRPDQREWRKHVHAASVEPTDDPARAARRIMTDDGFNTGILYRGDRPAFNTDSPAKIGDVAELEREFIL